VTASGVSAGSRRRSATAAAPAATAADATSRPSAAAGPDSDPPRPPPKARATTAGQPSRQPLAARDRAAWTAVPGGRGRPTAEWISR